MGERKDWACPYCCRDLDWAVWSLRQDHVADCGGGLDQMAEDDDGPLGPEWDLDEPDEEGAA